MLTVIRSMPSAVVQETLEDVSLNDVNSFDNLSNDDKLSSEMNEKMQLSEGESRNQFKFELKTNYDSKAFNFMFQTNPEELLKKVVDEQGRSLRLIDVAQRSKTGKFIFFAQIETPAPVIVFTGIGDSPEIARADSCRNALEYFRLVSDKS